MKLVIQIALGILLAQLIAAVVPPILVHACIKDGACKDTKVGYTVTVPKV